MSMICPGLLLKSNSLSTRSRTKKEFKPGQIYQHEQFYCPCDTVHKEANKHPVAGMTMCYWDLLEHTGRNPSVTESQEFFHGLYL